jgi:hypothetical protein
MLLNNDIDIFKHRCSDIEFKFIRKGAVRVRIYVASAPRLAVIFLELSPVFRFG